MPRAFVLPKQGVRQSTDAYAKSQLQQAVQQSQTQASAVPWADGKLVENVLIGPASSSSEVFHGLGRTPKGWMMLRNVGGGVVTVSSANVVNDKSITFFNPTAFAVLADVWVY